MKNQKTKVGLVEVRKQIHKLKEAIKHIEMWIDNMIKDY